MEKEKMTKKRKSRQPCLRNTLANACYDGSIGFRTLSK